MHRLVVQEAIEMERANRLSLAGLLDCNRPPGAGPDVSLHFSVKHGKEGGVAPTLTASGHRTTLAYLVRPAPSSRGRAVLVDGNWD